MLIVARENLQPWSLMTAMFSLFTFKQTVCLGENIMFIWHKYKNILVDNINLGF